MIITGGKYKGRKILAPDEKITRPTLSKVRQGVFNVLFSELGDFESKSFLDLFGGSGVMGLEALSRGFEEVVVFEKNPKVAQILKKNYATLNLMPKLKIGDSLKLLEKLDRKFDVIYIDPPYNTGNKDFVYDDVFVSTDDGFRHSKWASFIAKRLEIAKTLLSEKGFICISIDDNEYSTLKTLCDEIFGEENFIAQFIVVRSEGGGLAKQAVIGHDYCLVYAKNIVNFTPLGRPKDIRGKVVTIDNEDYWIETDWLRKEFGKLYR